MAAIPFRPEGRCERATADNPNGLHPTGLTASRRKGRRRTPAGFRWSGNRDPLRAVPRIVRQRMARHWWTGFRIVRRATVLRGGRMAAGIRRRTTGVRRWTAAGHRRTAVAWWWRSARRGIAGRICLRVACTVRVAAREQSKCQEREPWAHPILLGVWCQTLTPRGKAPQPGSRKCSRRLASLLLRRATQA
jgi:hypothetical protein